MNYISCHDVTAKQLFSRSRRYRAPRSSGWRHERTIRRWNNRFNSGGCLKPLNTASPRWPFQWDIRWTWLRVLAEHGWQIAMTLSSSATEKHFQTGEDMFTDDDVMSATQAESHCSLMPLALEKYMNLRSIRLIDWLTGKRTLSDFIYLSGNKNYILFTHIGR